MTYALCVLAGLVIGGLAAWLIASARLTRAASSRMDELAGRASTAEGRVTGLEGTIAELRAQNQRASDDFTKLREQLTNESSARVKAETQLAETVQRLEEEKKLLEDAKTKLTDTFKALAGDTLHNSTTAFLKLAKETLDKTLTDAKGDLGKRELDNYIHKDLIVAEYPNYAGAGVDFEDVPTLFAQAVHEGSSSEYTWADVLTDPEKLGKKVSSAKKRLNSDFASKMTAELLTAVDPNGDVRGWLREVGAALNDDRAPRQEGPA